MHLLLPSRLIYLLYHLAPEIYAFLLLLATAPEPPSFLVLILVVAVVVGTRTGL